MDKLIKLIKKSRIVFVCGNGGSSSSAEHFVTDLVKKNIKAICLSSNTSIMTMLANDFGYEQVFSKQLALYADIRDLLITISCSGTSPNIVSAIKYAKFKKIKVYEFETFIEQSKDYGLLEDKHLKFAHEVAKKL